MDSKKATEKRILWSSHFRAAIANMVLDHGNRWIVQRRKELFSIFRISNDYDEGVFQSLWFKLDRMEDALRERFRAELKEDYRENHRLFEVVEATKKGVYAERLKELVEIAHNLETNFQRYNPPPNWQHRFFRFWRSFLARYALKMVSGRDVITELSSRISPPEKTRKNGDTYMIGRKNGGR